MSYGVNLKVGRTYEVKSKNKKMIYKNQEEETPPEENAEELAGKEEGKEESSEEVV